MTADAMVLCAGLGTRLRPLTEEVPKPLVPVGDRPALAHIVAHLRELGLPGAVVNVHHLPDKFISELSELSLDLQVLVEDEIRGTAGGVAGARPHLRSDAVVVWNGDVLSDAPVAALLEGARASGGMCLAVRECARGEGTVGLASDGRVVRLRGESFGREERGGDYLGVLALGAAALAELPARGCLIGDYALPVLRRGGTVEARLCAPRYWFDIGDLESYLRANLDWLARTGRRAWRGSGAQVASGVRLEQSVVGAGAAIMGEGVVARAVIWPGARVQAPRQDCVVTSSGRIVSVR